MVNYNPLEGALLQLLQLLLLLLFLGRSTNPAWFLVYYCWEDATRPGLLHHQDSAGVQEVACEVLLVHRLAKDYMVTSWDPDLFRWRWEREMWAQDLS